MNESLLRVTFYININSYLSFRFQVLNVRFN